MSLAEDDLQTAVTTLRLCLQAVRYRKRSRLVEPVDNQAATRNVLLRLYHPRSKDHAGRP